MTNIDLSALAAARDGSQSRSAADVLTGLAAGSWAIAAADVFERRHANTQQR
jgi:hypothetical protein